MTVANARALRPVHCMTRHLHRDIARADDVVRGRFRVAGATLRVDGVPHWANLAIDGDRERWIEWSKFYYGLDLAHAFADTGDEAFVQAWERLVSSWIAQIPSGFGPTDALGRRLQNWIYAYDAFHDAPAFAGFAAGFDEALAARIAADRDYLQDHLTPERNHRTLELYALFIVALALPPSPDADQRLASAWRALQDNLLTDVRPDGVHREHSTHYHMVVLRSFVGARENARRAGLEVPEDFDRALGRALDFAIQCQRPDGTVPSLSDGDVGRYGELLVRAAELLNRPDVLFAATNGACGSPPAHACADFTDGGYFVQRSDWRGIAGGGRTHRHLIFDCGGLGDGGHGHYDTLSIVAWCGSDLLIDPGRYTYDATSEWRRWFKGTAAHNTVCVDGRDQTAFRPGKPKARPTATLLTRAAAPLLEIVGGEVISPEYDAIHRRHVLFVASEYWLLIDHLEARTPHDYDLRFHLAPGAEGVTTVGRGRVTAPAGKLLLDGPGAVRLEPGWYSPEYGVKQAAPVVSKLASQCVYAEFVTAVIPTLPAPVSAMTPQLNVSRRSNGSTDAVITGVAPDGSATDVVTWATDVRGACHATVVRRTR